MVLVLGVVGRAVPQATGNRDECINTSLVVFEL